MLRAPLTPKESSTAPKGCCWQKQIYIHACWILSVLEIQHGSIMRLSSGQAFLGARTRTRLVVDTSPWGISGILLEDDKVSEYFADAITTDDMSCWA